MTVQARYHKLLANHIQEAMAARHMDLTYCETQEEALAAALAHVRNGDTVSCGGSQTLRELGLLDRLREMDCRFLDPIRAVDSSARVQVAHDALASDVYFMSANAITESGELVNVDGIGNRVAALAFGPGKVVVIAGINKVAPTLEAAIQRARHQAAQMTLMLFQKEDPSWEALEKATQTAGNHLCVTSGAVAEGRMYVILVGAALGF